MSVKIRFRRGAISSFPDNNTVNEDGQPIILKSDSSTINAGDTGFKESNQTTLLFQVNTTSGIKSFPSNKVLVLSDTQNQSNVSQDEHFKGMLAYRKEGRNANNYITSPSEFYILNGSNPIVIKLGSLEIEQPQSGSYDTGLFNWPTTNRISNAFKDVNDVLKGLAPRPAPFPNQITFDTTQDTYVTTESNTQRVIHNPPSSSVIRTYDLNVINQSPLSASYTVNSETYSFLGFFYKKTDGSLATSTELNFRLNNSDTGDGINYTAGSIRVDGLTKIELSILQGTSPTFTLNKISETAVSINTSSTPETLILTPNSSFGNYFTITNTILSAGNPEVFPASFPSSQTLALFKHIRPTTSSRIRVRLNVKALKDNNYLVQGLNFFKLDFFYGSSVYSLRFGFYYDEHAITETVSTVSTVVNSYNTTSAVILSGILWRRNFEFTSTATFSNLLNTTSRASGVFSATAPDYSPTLQTTLPLSGNIGDNKNGQYRFVLLDNKEVNRTTLFSATITGTKVPDPNGVYSTSPNIAPTGNFVISTRTSPPNPTLTKENFLNEDYRRILIQGANSNAIISNLFSTFDINATPSVVENSSSSFIFPTGISSSDPFINILDIASRKFIPFFQRVGYITTEHINYAGAEASNLPAAYSTYTYPTYTKPSTGDIYFYYVRMFRRSSATNNFSITITPESSSSPATVNFVSSYVPNFPLDNINLSNNQGVFTLLCPVVNSSTLTIEHRNCLKGQSESVDPGWYNGTTLNITMSTSPVTLPLTVGTLSIPPDAPFYFMIIVKEPTSGSFRIKSIELTA